MQLADRQEDRHKGTETRKRVRDKVVALVAQVILVAIVMLLVVGHKGMMTA